MEMLVLPCLYLFIFPIRLITIISSPFYVSQTQFVIFIDFILDGTVCLLFARYFIITHTI